MADKRTRPRIIKILEESKMPPKNVIGSAWTFSEREKKKGCEGGNLSTTTAGPFIR